MIKFEKTDLLHQYTWTAHKENVNKQIVGFPENYFLYRFEGFEVLPFIKRYMNARGLDTLKSFHKIESVIRDGLPKIVSAHAAIKFWLENNIQCLH